MNLAIVFIFGAPIVGLLVFGTVNSNVSKIGKNLTYMWKI